MSRMLTTCRAGLHDLTAAGNLTADGTACRPCRRTSQRRWAAALRSIAAHRDELALLTEALVEALNARDDAAVRRLVTALAERVHGERP